MTVSAAVKITIIDDPAEIEAEGCFTSSRFLLKLEGPDGSITLTANHAAMVHGAIRGAWERNYKEKLPVS